MRLIIQTNPLFDSDEVIEGYRLNPRVRGHGCRPTVYASIQRLPYSLYSSNVHLIFPRRVDQVGDVSNDNPHSTWIAHASVFTNRREAYDWAISCANSWGAELNAWVTLPTFRGRRTTHEVLNSSPPRPIAPPITITDPRGLSPSNGWTVIPSNRIPPQGLWTAPTDSGVERDRVMMVSGTLPVLNPVSISDISAVSGIEYVYNTARGWDRVFTNIFPTAEDIAVGSTQ